MGIIKEFREFAVRGNVVDMAVGIIIGAAFGKIVSSMVNDVLMPPIGKMVGGVDFKDYFVVLGSAPAEGVPSLARAKELGVPTLNYGVFINEVINFTIVAFAVFLLVKAINTARRLAERDAGAPAAAAVPADVALLTEIRDLLRANRA